MIRNLRISGPTALPDAVRQAASVQMVSHRSEEFREVLAAVLRRLRPVFGTQGHILPFTASGTGGLEAAVVNTVVPGERVLLVSIGHFGERFGAIAKTFGADVHSCRFPDGEVADPSVVRAALRRHGPFSSVLLTHNETSTGVINPLRELTAVVRQESDALICADVVSSLGGVPVRMDANGIDVAVGVTQKALMAPPGLTLLAVSERAMERAQRQRSATRYYFDFGRMAEAVSEGTTTYTPAVTVVFALDAALRMLEEEGLQKVYQRHRTVADTCRNGLRALNVELVAAEGYASPTITALRVPAATSATRIRTELATRFGIAVASGRGAWKDSVLRVGHMGWVSEADVRDVTDRLRDVLSSMTRDPATARALAR